MPLLRDHNNIESRIYPRQRGGPARYYGDFRDFRYVGGGLDPLTAPEVRYATTNLDEAKTLAAARLTHLEALRKLNPIGDPAVRQLGKFAACRATTWRTAFARKASSASSVHGSACALINEARPPRRRCIGLQTK